MRLKAGAVAVVSLLLAGCGAASPASSEDVSTSAAPAPNTSSAAAARRIRVGDTVEVAVLAARIRAALRREGSGRLSETVGKELTSQGEFLLHGPLFNQRCQTTFRERRVETRSIDGVFYIRGYPGTTKEWLKIDPRGGSAAERAFAEVLRIDLADPAVIAPRVKGARATVVRAEPGKTSYRLTVDLAGLTQEGSRDRAVAVLYVVDSRSLPISVDATVAGERVSISYYDWGADVDVQAPPEDQVGALALH